MHGILYRSIQTAAIAVTVTFWYTAPVWAQPAAPLPLYGAESFAVLAGASVAGTGASVIGGDVGVGPGGTIVGVTPAMLTPGSALHAGDAVAAQALQAATATYTELAGRACPPPGHRSCSMAPRSARVSTASPGTRR